MGPSTGLTSVSASPLLRDTFRATACSYGSYGVRFLYVFFFFFNICFYDFLCAKMLSYSAEVQRTWKHKTHSCRTDLTCQFRLQLLKIPPYKFSDSGACNRLCFASCKFAKVSQFCLWCSVSSRNSLQKGRHKRP